MLTCDEVRDLILDKLPDAECNVSDMTGTSDHFDVQVVSKAFEGKSLIEQHKLIHAAVGMHLTTTIHALKITTSTP